MTRPNRSPSPHTPSPRRSSVRPATPENVIPPRSGIFRLASPPPWLDAGAGVCASAGATATMTTTSSTETRANRVMSARRACGGRAQVSSLMLWTPELGGLIFDLVVRMDAGHGFAGQPTRRCPHCQWEMAPKRPKSQEVDTLIAAEYDALTMHRL